MKALVTGAAGFVGRHVCKKLTDHGYTVLGIDNYMSESALRKDVWPKHLVCDVDLREGDIKEYFRTNKEDKFDLVVHLAAVVGGRSNIENSPLAVGEDLAIDALFFNWLTTAKPTKIVYFSSSAAYPIRNQTFDYHVELTEDMIDFNKDIGVADLTYGWSKLTGEFLAKLAHEKYGFDISCFRPFSGYGEDQHVSYPFPAILKRAISKENPIGIWSNAVRDFIHIDDCIDAMLLIMQKTHDGKGVNLGTGIATSFETLAKTMAHLVGYNADISIINNKPQGVYYRVADTAVMNYLGFYPTITLAQGIERSIKYNS